MEKDLNNERLKEFLNLNSETMTDKEKEEFF